MQMQEGQREILARQTRILRLQAMLLLFILAILVILCAGAFSEFARMRATLDLLETELKSLDISALNDTVDSLNDAARNLQSMDVQTLNDLVGSLNNTAQSLQGLLNGLSRLFP